MKLKMVEVLPFVDNKLINDRKQVILADVLIDTGSIAVDIAIELGFLG